MFSLRNFIFNGLIGAIGKMADYQVILNAAGWFEKGVLIEEDLVNIQTAIEKQYIIEDLVEENLIEENPVEE